MQANLKVVLAYTNSSIEVQKVFRGVDAIGTAVQTVSAWLMVVNRTCRIWHYIITSSKVRSEWGGAGCDPCTATSTCSHEDKFPFHVELHELLPSSVVSTFLDVPRDLLCLSLR